MKRKKVVAMSPGPTPWTNCELAKDCGIIPYLLMKNHNCDVSMVCVGGEEYPYLSLMPGLKMHFLGDNTIEAKIKYLLNNIENIDLVIFHGLTYDNMQMAYALKHNNAKCLIACALDMNPAFADRIPFFLPPFSDYLNSIDLMWQADSKMAEFLNEKWYWNIECVRYGYFNLVKQSSTVQYNPFDTRDNTLLYVGRLNDEQKNISLLLNVFSNISEKIPKWKLKLIGPVNSNFEEPLKRFLDTHENLRSRIEITGNITDKAALHNEFERAKIYVTTTRFEGGTPNAISEALCSGCVMAITKFSAYEDILADNKTGLSAEIDNGEDFANILLRLIHESDLRKMSQAAYERGNKLYNMERIVADLYGKLCDKGF